MKNVVGLFCCIVGLGFFGLEARCIQAKHVHEKVSKDPKGAGEKVKSYDCAVKNSEKGNFSHDSGSCKNCGCAPAWHDDM